MDRPDDARGREQVHAIYALPADGADRQLDTNGTLAAGMASWQGWLRAQAGGEGLRLDTAGGALDVSFVRLQRTDAQLEATGPYVRDRIEDELRARGLLTAGKIYAVYYDGRSNYSCGGGAYPPALPGQVGAIYLNGLPEAAVPCRSQPLAAPGASPGYFEFAMLHELLHTLGFVAGCAPNHFRTGHVFDSPRDLMYGGDEPWRPSVLDIGRDDYFATGRPNCADLAASPFREGGPVVPPGPAAPPDATPTQLPEPTPPPAATAPPPPTARGTGSPRRCRVPRLRGLTVPRARARLRRAGCRLGSISVQGRRGKGGARKVLSQRPRSGARGRRGMRVRVWVGSQSQR